MHRIIQIELNDLFDRINDFDFGNGEADPQIKVVIQRHEDLRELDNFVSNLQSFEQSGFEDAGKLVTVSSTSGIGLFKLSTSWYPDKEDGVLVIERKVPSTNELEEGSFTFMVFVESLRVPYSVLVVS